MVYFFCFLNKKESIGNTYQYMYDKNIQVASLEPNRIEEIACEINRLRMQEIPDKEISHTLMRYIQGEKIKVFSTNTASSSLISPL